jgi:hypothetical protein
MKSNLFKSNPSFAQDSVRLEPIRRDVAAMLTIPADKLPAFMETVREILNTDVAQHGKVADAALPKLGIERGIFDHACNVAGWLATEFFPDGSAKGDTPAAILDDMVELKIVTEEQKARCAGFVKAIKALVQTSMQSKIERDRALQRGAPKVMGVETALFFRNVFRKGPGKGD